MFDADLSNGPAFIVHLSHFLMPSSLGSASATVSYDAVICNLEKAFPSMEHRLAFIEPQAAPKVLWKEES